jgi:HD-GYP domain-containing protein (c-di-GMP phosphodiesterase class II)
VTTERPYSRPLTSEQAYRELRRGAEGLEERASVEEFVSIVPAYASRAESPPQARAAERGRI